ncbi:Inner membrane protein yedI [Raoultella ornithinolytica]|nr:Inner membrane protein yedI [Raoultella ornithinolytica]
MKLDDVGYWLVKKSSALARWVGNGLLAVAPRLMKLLSIVGTLAMFLVGGGHYRTRHRAASSCG